MKHSFLTALILLAVLTATLLPNITLALGWHLQYQEANHRTLYGVKFVDSLNGWVVGDSGIILHTANGGTNWNYQTSGTLRALRGVSFTDRNYGCAVGDSGKILHTNNGGTLWSVQTSGTNRALRSVSFTDSVHGCVVGDSGTILHTNNGGTTWNRQTSGTPYALNSVCFVDSSHGWAVGGYFVYPDTINMHSVITHTNNGGTSWSNQNASTNFSLSGVSFTDSNNGWAVGYGYDGIRDGVILHTINGGTTWNDQAGSCDISFTGVSCLDINRCWASAIWVHDFTYHGSIRRTLNTGMTWFDEAFLDNLYGISLTDTTHGWAVGAWGDIYFYSGYDLYVVKDSVKLPVQFELNQNYPNPFNSTTSITYNLLHAENIVVKIFDVNGREIMQLFAGWQNPGTHQINFDGKNLPSGIYFVRMQAGTNAQTRKMVLLK